MPTESQKKEIAQYEAWLKVANVHIEHRKKKKAEFQSYINAYEKVKAENAKKRREGKKEDPLPFYG